MTSPARPTARWRRRLAVLTVSGLAIAACGGGDDDTAEPDAEQTQSTDAPDAPEATDDTGDVTADTTEASSDAAAATSPPATDDNSEDGTPVVETIAPEENSEPVVGGTLRYALEADVNGINPVTSSLSAPGLQMGNVVFDTLAATKKDGGWTPYLAESFERSDDLKDWTMKLREGVMFHDGTPLNADAILVNFETTRQDPLVGLAIKPFFPEENAIEKVDDLTVIFHLLDAHANFPTSLTGQLGMVSSPTWLEAALADPTLNQAPVGTGPFKFASRSEDSITRFERNDDWWNGEVYLDAIEFLPVTDSATRTDLLFNGEIEGLQTTDQASILDLRDGDGLQNLLNDSAEESFAMINSAPPPFDDIRAREALAQATPIGLYADLIGLGVTRQASQAYIPESPYYNPDIQPVGDNPERAAELVAEYCGEKGGDQNPVTGTPTCTDGKINIEYQWSGPSVVNTRIADLLDQAWSASFNVTFDELLQDEHILQTAIGQYNVNQWRQFGAEDPAGDNVWLLCRTIGGISLNWPRLCDEERDALLLQAQALETVEERAPLYQEVSQRIHDDYLYIFYNHTLWDLAFQENVKGLCDRTSPEGEALTCDSSGRTWFSSAYIE
ncbi:MAG: ABC transporter substrate-binding protein [Ilumatobacteraceae bacterium]